MLPPFYPSTSLKKKIHTTEIQIHINMYTSLATRLSSLAHLGGSGDETKSIPLNDCLRPLSCVLCSSYLTLASKLGCLALFILLADLSLLKDISYISMVYSHLSESDKTYSCVLRLVQSILAAMVNLISAFLAPRPCKI